MAQCQQMCWWLTNAVATIIFPPHNETGQLLSAWGTTSEWGGRSARISLRPAGLGSWETLSETLSRYAGTSPGDWTDSGPGYGLKHKPLSLPL